MGSRQGSGGLPRRPCPQELWAGSPSWGTPAAPGQCRVHPVPPGTIHGHPVQRTEPNSPASQSLGDSKKGVLGPKGKLPSPTAPADGLWGHSGGWRWGTSCTVHPGIPFSPGRDSAVCAEGGGLSGEPLLAAQLLHLSRHSFLLWGTRLARPSSPPSGFSIFEQNHSPRELEP